MMQQPSYEEVLAIGEGFLNLTLPAELFDHRAHLIATTYALVTYPDRDWATELPRRIRAFNISSGGTNDDASGYHHTITMAFLAIIGAIAQRTEARDVVAVVTAVLSSPVASRDFLLHFWTPRVLLSRQARTDWVPPDLHPQDWTTATTHDGCAAVALGSP